MESDEVIGGVTKDFEHLVVVVHAMLLTGDGRQVRENQPHTSSRGDEGSDGRGKETRPLSTLVSTKARTKSRSTSGKVSSSASNWLRITYNALVEPGSEPALAEPDPGGREQQPYVSAALQGRRQASWFRSVEGERAIVAVAEPVSDRTGTIGAVGDNGIGITGVNWNVQLMALKFLGADGSGSQSDAIEAVLYAVNNGAHVINASWGGDPFSQVMFDALVTARDARRDELPRDAPATRERDRWLVRRVQELPVERGYHPDPIDGPWARRAAAAVRAFQRDRGIGVDGALDASTPDARFGV